MEKELMCSRLKIAKQNWEEGAFIAFCAVSICLFLRPRSFASSVSISETAIGLLPYK